MVIILLFLWLVSFVALIMGAFQGFAVGAMIAAGSIFIGVSIMLAGQGIQANLPS